MIVLWNIVFVLVGTTIFVKGGEIIEAPANMSVALNGIATLRCVVIKDGNEEVHWIKDDDLLLFVDRTIVPGAIADGYRYSVVGQGNEYNLKITQVVGSDDGKYTCKVQSATIGGTTVSRSSNLIVHRPPTAKNPSCTVDTNTDNYQAGTTVQFQCNSERGYPDVNLKWRDQNGAVDAFIDTSRQGFFTLYFNRFLTPSDNRRLLTCTSSYSSSFVGNQTGSCDIGPLNVQYPPTDIGIEGLVYNIDNIGNVDFGKALLLTCNGTGGNPPLLTYSWTITPPIAEDRLKISSHLLIMNKIEKEDQDRVIQCSATNGIGTIFSPNITINVTNIPTTKEPTTIITTEPATTVKVIPPPTMPFSTVYIIIVILVALVILLATVCLVLFLVNRKKKDVLIQHMPVSVASSDVSRCQNYGRQCSTNTFLDAYSHEDACSLKGGKCSRPGTPVMDRKIPDVELEALSSAQLRAHDNLYGDNFQVQPEDSVSNIIRRSPLPQKRMLSDSDDLKKQRTPRESPESSTCSHCSYHSRNAITPNPDKPHRKLKPTNSTGPDWPTASEKGKNYSPLARRHYSPQDNHYEASPSPGAQYHTIDSRPRRATQSELEDIAANEHRSAFVKTHRRNRSQGSASLTDVIESPTNLMTSPVFVQRHHAPSPVMQRKQKRQHSSSSLNQLQVLQCQHGGSSPRHVTPRSSPRPSPHHSPAHRPHANRPLPDPGLEHHNDLLVDFDDYGANTLPPQGYSGMQQHTHGRRAQSMPRQVIQQYDEYYDDDYNDDDDDSSDLDEVCELHGAGAACDCNNIGY
ncbi:uncharacterized protein [Amphiura filiformis]|uniref:uncharacterized protein n=1 Tax=Amphiura filiformis TaxID=82378 RepID=UPI003B2164BF